MDYQTLIDQEKYDEAAEELKRRLALEPDDKYRGLLAWCLWICDKTEDALQIATQIEQPTPRNYELLARLHWQLEQWDKMAFALKSAQRKEPSAEVYHLLAIAEARGRYLYQIDTASKEIMRGYLAKATEFDNCSVDVYLFLSHLYLHLDKDNHNRITTLFKAFEKYPDNPDIRLELASAFIYKEGQYEKAIELLNPLIDNGNRGDEAKGYVFEALFRQGKYAEASNTLKEIHIEDTDQVTRIKADLLFRQGKIGDWLIYSDEFVGDNSSEAIARKNFRRAYVNLRNGDSKQAISDFTIAAELLLNDAVTISNDIYFRKNLCYCLQQPLWVFRQASATKWHIIFSMMIFRKQYIIT